MKRIALMVVGLLLVLIGLVWTLQGLGYVKGSGMSGQTLWAIVGPLVAVIGVILGVQGLRMRRR